MKSISLGQYYPAKSYLHKADPRIKLIMTIIFIIASFVCKNIFGFIGLLLYTFLLILISRIPIKMILKAIRTIMFIMIFTTLINVFWTTGREEHLSSWYFVSISKYGC